jgi:hypothetical protein
MKLVTKLVITGSLIAVAAVLVEKERIRRNRPRPHELAAADPGDVELDVAVALGVPDDAVGEEVAVIATSSGIADVDPEPLAQTAGEGIALDPVTAAHTEIEDLRERLPRPSKGT